MPDTTYYFNIERALKGTDEWNTYSIRTYSLAVASDMKSQTEAAFTEWDVRIVKVTVTKEVVRD
jgi:hypothetical protein